VEKNKKTILLISRGIIILPNDKKTIEFARSQSVLTIQNIKDIKNDYLILVSQIDDEDEDPDIIAEVFSIGTLCSIKKSIKKEENGEIEYSLELLASNRVKIFNQNYNEQTGYETNYEIIKDDLVDHNNELVEVIANINETFEPLLKIDYKFRKFYKSLDIANNPIGKMEPIFFANKLAIFIENNESSGSIPLIVRQQLLEANNVVELLKVLYNEILRLLDPNGIVASQVDSEINEKINKNLARQQKEFYLREKLRVIREDLGEINSKDDEIDKIKKRVSENPYPKIIKDKILSELAKYESSMSSNENTIIITYIDWLLDIPWWQVQEDNDNLVEVAKVLDENHYGLEKVKTRIIEYLAVRTKNKNLRGPILCLVGPPGVGKTSLANSIAEALNKKFVKVSLGGVKDESEIRGHRKTYIGSMPGRIIKGMKAAGVINPLFLLDEIDKMSNDHKGDPSSAMLEVLDAEQNSKFSDNYIEEEYNLNQVMFIATANYFKQIPYALLDRLEIIELNSYTPFEKKEIAKKYLIKKIKKDALLPDSLVWEDEAIDFIINHFTREAGVRELERQLSTIARKYVVEELKGLELPTKIDIKNVSKYLGKILYDTTNKDEVSLPGIVNGMAYTSFGGDLLPIEASFSKGKGKIVITGNLEQTMTESVTVAWGFVKSNAKKFKLDHINFQEIDIHIHVPSGGIPKDGPSAGVAITTAILSLLKNKPINTSLSMTGEITLRGKVGIIGGVKEKIISAYRAGIREVYIPIDDERFLDEIPLEISKDINVHLIKNYDDIYQKLFKD